VVGIAMYHCQEMPLPPFGIPNPVDTLVLFEKYLLTLVIDQLKVTLGELPYS
jgi:hypothetical protein